MPYTLHDHTADVAFEATGKDLNTLFTSAAEAMMDLAAERKGIGHEKTITVTLEHAEIEELLHNFLEEFVYYKDAEQLLFSAVAVEITKNEIYHLKATLQGEQLNPEKHELRNDIKAVTYHLFKIEQIENTWRAYVIVDI